MVLFNYAIREITAKLVYYGPGLGGKTTNLQKIHENIEPRSRGKLISLATDADRTLFFDFLPIDLGQIGGYRVRFQLYTVPGQVHYNATRKLVLKGVDAIVFVADSQIEMLERNRESFENLKENLAENGYDWKIMPIAYQFNKQDLPNTATPEEVVEALGLDPGEVTWFPGVAVEGKGVFETLKAIIKLTINKLRIQFEDGQLGGVARDREKGKPTAVRGKAKGQEAEPSTPVPVSAPKTVPEIEPEPVPAPEPEPIPEPEQEEGQEGEQEGEQEDVLGEVRPQVPAEVEVHEVDLDTVLAESSSSEAPEADLVDPTASATMPDGPGSATGPGSPELPPLPPGFAPAEESEEEMGLADESLLVEEVPLVKAWEQAVPEQTAATDSLLWGAPGADGKAFVGTEEAEAMEVTQGQSPDYYTMEMSPAEAQSLAPQEEAAVGYPPDEIWPEPVPLDDQPRTGADAENAPVPVAVMPPEAPLEPPPREEALPPPAQIAAGQEAEIAALRRQLTAVERSLADIYGALIEQRSLMNKVIDLAVGRMFNPAEEGNPREDQAGTPPRRGFWARLFGDDQ